MKYAVFRGWVIHTNKNLLHIPNFLPIKLFLIINNVAASTSLMTKQDSVVLGIKQNKRLLLPQIHCQLTKDNIYKSKIRA